MPTWTKKQLNKIKKTLPAGWIEQLADEFSLSAGSIKNIMCGCNKNDKVILRAIQLATDNNKKQQLVLNQAKEALQNLK